MFDTLLRQTHESGGGRWTFSVSLYCLHSEALSPWFDVVPIAEVPRPEALREVRRAMDQEEPQTDHRSSHAHGASGSPRRSG